MGDTTELSDGRILISYCEGDRSIFTSGCLWYELGDPISGAHLLGLEIR